MPDAYKTINSNLEAFATVADLFVYHDSEMVADMLRDGQVARPTLAVMLTVGSPSNVMLVRFLKLGTGLIESACLIARYYSPADLARLVEIDPATSKPYGGGSAEFLIKLNADLTYYALAQRRQPNAGDPKNIPGAVEALATLDKLRDGERIFSFTETQEAGLVSVVTPEPSSLVTPNVVGRARRVYPNYGMNAGNQQGDN